MLILIAILLIVAFIIVKYGWKFYDLSNSANNSLKGKSFEARIKKIMLNNFPDAKIINNIIIKNGKYSKEFDVIALTKKGFFVIEAKNYNYCDIIGDVDGRYWTCIYENGKQYPMYNPILQAEAGARSLNKHISNIHFEDMVVFSDICRISEKLINHKKVYKVSSFERALENIKNRADIYDQRYIDDVCKKIDKLEKVSKAEHLKNIEEIKKKKAH